MLKRMQTEISKRRCLIGYIINTKYTAFFIQFVCEKIKTELCGHALIVTSGDNEYRLDVQSGEVESVRAGGAEYGRISLNVLRAPIDNDMYIRQKWDARYLKSCARY